MFICGSSWFVILIFYSLLSGFNRQFQFITFVFGVNLTFLLEGGALSSLAAGIWLTLCDWGESVAVSSLLELPEVIIVIVDQFGHRGLKKRLII